MHQNPSGMLELISSCGHSQKYESNTVNENKSFYQKKSKIKIFRDDHVVPKISSRQSHKILNSKHMLRRYI